MEKFNLQEKFDLITDYWSPKIVAELNGQQVKLAKLKGEFVWHHHENEDELFFVVQGRLIIQMRDQDVSLGPGECFVVPAGAEHRPVAEEEVHLLLLEPASTVNTGSAGGERTVGNPEWI